MNEHGLLSEIRAMQNARADRTDNLLNEIRKEFSNRMDQQDAVLLQHGSSISMIQAQQAFELATGKLGVHRVPHTGLPRPPKLAAKLKKWTIIATSAIGLLTATIAAIPKGVWITIRSWIC